MNLFVTSSYDDVYLKAESDNKNKIRMPGGQVKPNVVVSSIKMISVCILGPRVSEPFK